jgi:hypothetical protein
MKTLKELFMKEESDTTEKNEMAENQLHFIKYAAEEILEYIKMGGKIEEWYQNKLSKVQSEVESLHSYIEGESRRTGMKEEVELEESFTDDHINTSRQAYGNIKRKKGIEKAVDKLTEEQLNERSLADIFRRLSNHPDFAGMPVEKIQRAAYKEYLRQESVEQTLVDEKKMNENVDLTAHSPINAYVEAIKADMKFTDRMIFENQQPDDDPHHEKFKKEADSYSDEEHEMARRLHEDWRKNLPDNEKDDPRDRSKMGGPKRPINVDYDKLHPSAKLENLAAARAAIQAVRLHGDNKEAAAEHIHNEWMKRNKKDDYTAHLHVPYDQLPEHEKQKDREHHRIASEILAKRSVNESVNFRNGKTLKQMLRKSLFENTNDSGDPDIEQAKRTYKNGILAQYHGDGIKNRPSWEDLHPEEKQKHIERAKAERKRDEGAREDLISRAGGEHVYNRARELHAADQKSGAAGPDGHYIGGHFHRLNYEAQELYIKKAKKTMGISDGPKKNWWD